MKYEWTNAVVLISSLPPDFTIPTHDSLVDSVLDVYYGDSNLRSSLLLLTGIGISYIW